VTAAAQLNVDGIELPKQHKISKGYCGPVNAHVASSAGDYYYVKFVSLLDVAVTIIRAIQSKLIWR
jgi:hypothetical protein